MGSKSPGNTSQPPAFFSKLTESNSAMVKSKKQEINKKLNTHNRNEPEYSKGPACPWELGGWRPAQQRKPAARWACWLSKEAVGLPFGWSCLLAQMWHLEWCLAHRGRSGSMCMNRPVLSPIPGAKG